MPRNSHLRPVPVSTVQNSANVHTRRISGAWTLVAATVGAFVTGLITATAQFPVASANPANWIANDLDLVPGMLVGGLAGAVVFATTVRRLGVGFRAFDLFDTLGVGAEPERAPIRNRDLE